MFTKILLVASLIVAASCAPSLDGNWNLFKQRFDKTYDTVHQEQARRYTWQQNLKHINAHNERYNLGQETFTLAMNQFGDLSSAEFGAMYNGYRQSNSSSQNQVFNADNFEDIPDTVDWRTKGIVTPIKDQGQCGSCWAFSAVASLEGQHALKDSALVSLSEQNLVDCSGPEGNEGCGGGLMDSAFNYIKKNNGIDTEASYPYQAQDGRCRFKSNSVGATLSSWTDVASGDETALATAIANVGPISVAIDASQTSFQFYHSGVYYESSCSSTQLDHGVTAVGYGADFYWVKNSWGTTWGNQGYIQMSRNKNNNCGISTAASYPVV